jgi:hypothetical protein
MKGKVFPDRLSDEHASVLADQMVDFSQRTTFLDRRVGLPLDTMYDSTIPES